MSSLTVFKAKSSKKRCILKCHLSLFPSRKLKVQSIIWATSSEKVPLYMCKMHIHFILHMCKVSSGPLFSIHKFCNRQWFMMHGCAGWFGHLLSTIYICQKIYSRLSLSRSPRESLKYFKISVPRHNYQICRIEEKINQTTIFHKWICNLTPEVRDILKILWKRGEIAPEEQFLLFSTIFCYLLLDFHVKTGTRISIRDKRSFEISEVEIMRVNCIFAGCRLYDEHCRKRTHMHFPGNIGRDQCVHL